MQRLSSEKADSKYLFVFGDSYTATGFNSYGAKPSHENPIGNPDLPGLTSSGGLNWPGYLATEFNKSMIYAYVLAVGGATVDSSIVPSFAPSVSDQVRLWTQHLGPKPAYAPWTTEHALFAIWIGVNDIGNSYMLPTERILLKQDLDRLFVLLGSLYASGARNFVVLNVPPTQSTPRMKALANITQLGSAIALWNSQLPALVARFKSDNREANFTLVDVQPTWHAILSDPKRYGAPDADCANLDGKSCLWHDDYHPGLAIHRAVANTVAETLRDSFFLV
ncbi:hypothetical protein DL546_002436 [Coniochaeta pulveracea]|uniref:Carbohydrate esterase family 16 protein n=1 Tax=Coniochaeta pulveracea TaxID=177199 RepID=A0A420Y0I9_9PEZI|nr:hypothetical protein DL546_002436 [Coniochaeta pulveracea]